MILGKIFVQTLVAMRFVKISWRFAIHVAREIGCHFVCMKEDTVFYDMIFGCLAFKGKNHNLIIDFTTRLKRRQGMICRMVNRVVK